MRHINDFKTEFLQLYYEGKRDYEIADILGFTRTTVCYYRKHMLGLPKNRAFQTLELTDSDREILVGTLMGDATLGKCSSDKTVRVQISHIKKNEEYLMWIKQSLPTLFIYNPYETIARDKIINGKSARSNGALVIYSCKAPCLDELYKVFYSGNRKVIPIDYLNKYFTAKSLAILFMDDGCKNCSTINLNLQCFELEELEKFVIFLKEKFNLEFIIKKDKTLYLRYNSRETFYNLVIPFITADMLYKISGIVSSLNSVKRGNLLDNPVLNPQETVENA